MKAIAIALSIISPLFGFGATGVSATELAPPAAPLFPSDPTVFELISVANHFIALGEEETFAEVTRRWNADRRDSSLAEQISWLCRLLYIPKDEKNIREPGFGGWRDGFGPNSFEGKDWPFFPLFQSQGIFFLFPANYLLAGSAEDPIDYLKYNRENGEFRRRLFTVPSEENARRALEAFFASHAWKNIKWIETPWAMSTAEELIPYFRAQTKNRANQPPLRMPVSGTPAASASAEPTADRGAPVAPPPGIAGR
jgi:hypothetical protein